MALVDNHVEFMSVCKVDAFSYHKPDVVTIRILAEVAVQKDGQALTNKINDIVSDVGKSVSIGKALETLVSVTEIGKEFNDEYDGIDALTYHLSLSSVENAIKALNKVKTRMTVA